MNVEIGKEAAQLRFREYINLIFNFCSEGQKSVLYTKLFVFVTKFLHRVEYRAVSRVFQNIDPPPPSPPRECVLPPHQRRGGGVHTRRAERGVGGGPIFWKTRHIGSASYSIISLRFLSTSLLTAGKPADCGPQWRPSSAWGHWGGHALFTQGMST